MQLRFQPMSNEEFQSYLRRVVPEYANEFVHTGNWHPDEAVNRAREQFMRIFPKGPQSPNQILYTIWDVEKKITIGMLWYTIDDSRLNKMAFLSDFFIHMEHHNQGYEDAALALLENELRQQNIHRMEVNIFAHNLPEKALYEKNGFQPVSLYLGKNI